MKKILAMISLSLMFTSSFAGFYLGAGAGVRPTTGRLNEFNVFGVQINTITLGATEPAADFSAGYDFLLNNGIYFGLDAFFEFVNIDESYTAAVAIADINASAGVRVRLSDNFGAKIYFGYSPSDRVIFYTDLGALLDKVYYTASAQIVGHGVSTAGDHVAGAANIGLGMLYRLGNNFRLRAEYDYARYPSRNIPIPVNIPAIGTQTIQFVPTISVNAVTIGLQYEFGAI